LTRAIAGAGSARGGYNEQRKRGCGVWF